MKKMICIVFLMSFLIFACLVSGEASSRIVPDSDTAVLMDRLCSFQCFFSERSFRDHLLWYYTGDDNASCIRCIGDVNNDNISDVVAGYDMYQENENLFCFSGASSGIAEVIWSLETTGGASGGYFWGNDCITAGFDADGNGYPNVLVGLAGGGRFAASYDGKDGTLLWRFDTYNEVESGWVYSIHELGDVTGDGVPEVIFGCGSDNDHAYCIDGTASGTDPEPLWWLALPDASFSVAPINDVNGDNLPDALISSGDPNGHHVICVDGASSGSATVLWTCDVAASVHAVLAVDDVNGNNVQDFVALTTTAGIVCGDGSDGSLIWQKTFGYWGMSVTCIHDLNGDGISELVVGSWDDAVWCFDGATGNDVWHTDTGGDTWTTTVIPDINGDGIEDVLAGSFDHYVYCLSGADGSVFWNYDTGNRVMSVSGSSDLNGDGVADALAGTQDTTTDRVVYAFSCRDISPTTTPTPSPVPSRTPVPTATPTCPDTGVTCDLNKELFHPGDRFRFRVTACNSSPEQPLDAPLFILLDVWGTFFYYPDWQTDPNYIVIHLPPCTCHTFSIFDFTWPETGTSGADICFYAALTDIEITSILGKMDTVCFGWD